MTVAVGNYCCGFRKTGSAYLRTGGQRHPPEQPDCHCHPSKGTQMMDGFALLLGHLVGDYVVQTDWMAINKSNPLAPCPGPEPQWTVDADPQDREEFKEALIARNELMAAHQKAWMKWQDARLGHLACTVHCLCYTLAVWAFSFWWMPWWGLLLCFTVHWPVDRFRLARWWMENVSGQATFATGPLAPWSIIVVDNVFHLLTLYGIWLLTGVI